MSVPLQTLSLFEALAWLILSSCVKASPIVPSSTLSAVVGDVDTPSGVGAGWAPDNDGGGGVLVSTIAGLGSSPMSSVLDTAALGPL